jgi:DNA-binding GntR family transcriptional regulator
MPTRTSTPTSGSTSRSTRLRTTPFLAEQAAALQRKLRPYRRLQLRVRNRIQRSFEEHQAIVDALTEGDAEKAVLSVRNHVIVQGERFADLVSSLSRLDAPPDRTEPQTGLAPAI